MGSVNPVVILPKALANQGEDLVSGLVGSLTLGSGQFCTNPGLVFLIDSPEAERFIKDVAEKMATGQPGVLLNQAIEKGLSEAVAATLETAVCGKTHWWPYGRW